VNHDGLFLEVVGVRNGPAGKPCQRKILAGFFSNTEIFLESNTNLTAASTRQRVCMKPSGELWVAVGNEGNRPREIVLAHGRLKVGERFLPRLTLPVLTGPQKLLQGM